MKIVLILLLIFWLIGRLRIGVLVKFNPEDFWVKARFGALKIQIYPPLKSKVKKEKKSKKVPKPKKKNLGNTLVLAQKMIPIVCKVAEKFHNKLRIDLLELHLIWGSEECSVTAMGYGYANAALGMILPVIVHNFNVKNQNITTDIDFNRTSPALYLDVSGSLTIGQGLVLALGLLKELASLKNSNN